MKMILGIGMIYLAGLAFSNPFEKVGRIGVMENSGALADRVKYEDELLQKLNIKCSQSDVNSCVMLKLVTYMNQLLKKASIELTDDIEIKQTKQDEEVINLQTARNEDEESVIIDLITSKIYAFIKSRSIKWKFLPEDDVVISASEDTNGSLKLGVSIERSDNIVSDGRGKKNNMGPLLAAAILKIGLIGGLAFKGLALLVGKALLLSKIALLLASIIGLKKLFSQQKHVTYEVVAHPHTSSSHTFSDHGTHSDNYGGGWSRNFQEQSTINGHSDSRTMTYSTNTNVF